MKILYVVSRPLEINTSSSIRNRATIEGLLKIGHEVDLITTEFDKNHSNYDQSLSYSNLNVSYLKLGGIQDIVKLSRKFKVIQPLKKLAYNLIKYFEIYDNLKGVVDYVTKDKIDITDNKYDLIISSSDPKSSHLFVRKMFERRLVSKTPWIQIWGDPFLSDITRSNKLLNSKIKKEEKKLFEYANKIIYVSKLTLNEQKMIYPNYAIKMDYVPIPYVKEEIYPNRDSFKENLTFLYSGDYSSKIRDIQPLYDAINNSRHSLIICGLSDINIESTDRIKVYPRVSFEKTKEFEKKCDVLVHLSNIEGTQIPGKIYQYSGTNKLILFILDGQKETLLKTFNNYNRYVFADNNKNEIFEKITRIENKEFENTKFIVEDFCSENIVSKIININAKVIVKTGV
ncbi:hypothetical protein GC096_10860 [Paenibacillus sp. LMG 31461]|uniref:Glycosyltransferase subfamily 4-like N-terminal domain-containing protein n=1 Tax=Paenibacillus plantarum TaxID=2654975 RepID=A0ABX1X823_9BACL|nr:hypothetical protein [Paenibacillus plantarum]NOU64529.1 hypothetical protein [Paenibacillus plantarum]